jgi:hypothetical protein
MVLQRREFHEALLEATTFEELPGKWQAAIIAAEQNRPELRLHQRRLKGRSRQRPCSARSRFTAAAARPRDRKHRAETRNPPRSYSLVRAGREWS